MVIGIKPDYSAATAIFRPDEVLSPPSVAMVARYMYMPRGTRRPELSVRFHRPIAPENSSLMQVNLHHLLFSGAAVLNFYKKYFTDRGNYSIMLTALWRRSVNKSHRVQERLSADSFSVSKAGNSQEGFKWLKQ